ncbi:MAG: hypothetical protein MZU91_00560 [Desulfosudis oleivorans]|nr:hypothetical protein [Desulfosudis oleivorans]
MPAVTTNIDEGQETECKADSRIIGTGPGRIEHITPYARDVLQIPTNIVGYGPYLELIRDLLTEGMSRTGMTREGSGCRKVVEIARTGRKSPW